MALPKLYERIIWHNDTNPALNEDNLNAMSKGLDDVDDRVIALGNGVFEVLPQIREYLEQAEEMIEALEEMNRNPPKIGDNGNWWIWDIDTEQYVDTGIDASITVTIADITMLEPTATPYVTNTGTSTDPIFHLFIPRGKGISSIAKTGTSGLIDTYTITYSDGLTTTFTVGNGKGITSISKTSTAGLVDTYTISYNDGAPTTFTVTNGKSAYQSAIEGGYTGTEAQFLSDLGNFSTWAADATQAADDAQDSADNAQQSAEDAEAWAIGKRNGQAVPSTDETYENNSHYYSQQCISAVSDAQHAADEAQEIYDDISSLLVVPVFTIDFSSGELIYSKDDIYNFTINNTNGELEWEVIA